MVLAVNTGVVTTPAALLAAVYVRTLPAKLPLAPLPGAVNVTVTLGTGLLPASTTVACNTAAKAVFAAALCGVPPLARIDPADPAVLVRVKLAVLPTPATAAVTVKLPANPLAVSAPELAWPCALVTAV